MGETDELYDLFEVDLKSEILFFIYNVVEYFCVDIILFEFLVRIHAFNEHLVEIDVGFYPVIGF
jgi:hypothetical protein